MKLLDFCEEVYQDGDRHLRNGLPVNQNKIILMIGIIYQNYVDGFNDRSIRFPSVEVLLDLDMSENEQFSEQNLADMIGLVFDVVTDQNHNPTLWSDRLSINAEISHTFMVLIHGPAAQIGGTGEGAVIGTKYASVKESLLEALRKSRNLGHP